MKLWIRRILNLLLWLNLCFIAGTAIILFWKLPPGREGGHGLMLWGFSRHDWGDIHAIAGLAFVLLIIAHLYIAWPWLKNAACGRRLWPVFIGIAAGVGMIVLLALSRVDKDQHENRKHISEPKVGLRIGTDQGLHSDSGRLGTY